MSILFKVNLLSISYLIQHVNQGDKKDSVADGKEEWGNTHTPMRLAFSSLRWFIHNMHYHNLYIGTLTTL